MKSTPFILVIAFMVLAGCSNVVSRELSSSISKENVGQKITIEGWAVNSKAGAFVVSDNNPELWMTDFDSWPNDYYSGGDRGKKVRVTGTLGEDNGLPVFIPKKDEPIVQGIPVPEGTDLDAASQRFVIKDATWELLR